MKPQVTIIIAMMDNGQITVNGPLENKVLCYGMLGMAQDIIQNYDRNGMIVTPNAIQVNEINKEKENEN